jgi:glycosyltransferase involved in cell wall biosynthesis
VATARVPGVRGPRRLPLPVRPLAAAWEVGVPLRPWAVDLVHAPTLLTPPASRRSALVVTVHDAVPWTHPETLTPRGVRWHRAMAARAAARADALVVPTEAVARELAVHLELRAPVVVAGAGVSARLDRPDDAAERLARLGLGEGHLVTVATLEPRKGLDVLLQALALAPGRLPPLAVVGRPGWGGVEPVAMARDLGLPEGAVRQLGGLSDADLAAVLSAASVAVVPSRAEGFGLPVVEAMAAGVPVVTSDAAALVEVGGGATRVVPVGDVAALSGALVELVADGHHQEELRAAGLQRAGEFTWEAVARRLWRLYTDVLAQRG